MSKFKVLRDTLYTEGFRSVLKIIWEYILISGPIAPYTKSILGDELHQKLYMYSRLGYWPKIRNPRTFNEKVMYRKLYTDNELFSIIEDKWRVREYVAERIGKEILPEIYHVTDDPETIPFDELPEQYVIKPNHLSGGSNFIIDKDTKPNVGLIKQRCSEWLDQKFGQIKGEYWYADITPKILVEEFIESEKYKTPVDYKFMVFHGEVKVIHVTYNRFNEEVTKRNFYNENWKPIDVKLHFEQGEGISEPPNLDNMIEIAETLGKDFDHIRVDLYNPNKNKIHFGEMTVAESSGGNPFVPQKYDFKFGSLW